MDLVPFLGLIFTLASVDAGGQCHRGSSTCECEHGWEGTLCETAKNYCKHNVLSEGKDKPLEICGTGQCIYDATKGVSCKCLPGTEGKWCEKVIDECKPNPCQNGAKCIDGDNDYTCVCGRFYEGKNCEKAKDLCKIDVHHNVTGETNMNPCGKHGKCVSSPGGGFNCSCDEGYGGHFCEIKEETSCPHKGKVYPHQATWFETCDSCTCNFGHVVCTKASWCPKRCAMYDTDQTRSHNITTDCPDKNTCIPDHQDCAHSKKENPCANPIGWCLPVGQVVIKNNVALPTNPPGGYVIKQKKKK